MTRTSIAAVSSASKAVLLLAGLLFTSFSFAQRHLKLQQMKTINYDKDAKEWEKWPAEWSVFNADSQPLMTIKKNDDEGKEFHVEFVISGVTYAFNVTYTEYDPKNKYTKYKDGEGNTVAVSGATLSTLYNVGWPEDPAKIYFWVKKETAIVFQ